MRQEVKWEREGGWDRERSVSRDSNLGRPKRNGATCQHVAHEAIGASSFLFVDLDQFITLNKWQPT